MSGIQGHDGYYLKKTGERVNELLSRHFIVPTLDHIPTEDDTSWQDGEYTVLFRVGEFVRVPLSGDYAFYRLKDITNDGAVWVEANSVELQDYYTKKEIDDKIANLIITGGNGGVEVLTPDEYEEKKNNGNIIDNIIYFLVVNDEPYELYIGTFLIGQRGEAGNVGFPYTFPIIF